MKKFIIIVSVGILTACSADVNTSAMKNDLNNVSIYDDKTSIYKNDRFYVNENMDNIEKFSSKNQNLEEREENLEKNIKKLRFIQDAKVNIVGNIAVVSIQINKDLNDRNLITLKKDIENLIKGIDSKIDHVSVNTSLEIFDDAKKTLDIADDKSDNLTHDSDLGEFLDEKIPTL